MYSQALAYLQHMLGPEAAFREGQWEAIEAVVNKTQRLLVVQRTGWGKSLVYFLATRLLRNQGKGPSLLISPLLALMRNQILMAEKIGVRAATINSANLGDWEEVETRLARDEVDILLISPERLNSERFLEKVLPAMQHRLGLFVVDEVHCISDWGHDFRPDYQRIVRIVKLLPKSVPVVGVTATANDRVVQDVVSQLGSDLRIIRGPLMREGLRLRNLVLADQAERLAWLAENLPKFPGSGIIYSLTVADSNRVARWLQQQGLDVRPYNADMTNEERIACEEALLNNQVKALSATVALGMGFDKPDLSFVIHFQRPGNVVAYYQQVGRAGRALKASVGILLAGREDDEIQNYFIVGDSVCSASHEDQGNAAAEGDGQQRAASDEHHFGFLHCWNRASRALFVGR
jgi:ATP-dependent DNA helicase RecQ